MIRILIVDDQNIVRQGLQALLNPKPDLKVIGTADNGKSALEQVKNLQPDLVLIDIEMPGMDGVTATQKICQLFPATKVIVLTSHEDLKYVAKALQAGAKGYLLKQTLADDLEKAIWSVCHGYSQVESQLLEKIIADSTLSSVTSEQNKTTLARDNLSLAKTSSELAKDAESEKLLANNVTSIFNHNKYSNNSKKNQASLADRREKSTLVVEANTRIQQTETKKKSNINKYLSNANTSQKSSNTNNLVGKKTNKQPSTTPESQLSKRALGKFKTWSIVGAIITIALLTMGIIWIRWFDRRNSQPASVPTPVPVAVPAIKTVLGLGRIEPEGKAIALSPPTSLEAAKVEQLLVKEGDRIKQGDIVAILDGRQRQLAAVEEAKTQVEIAQARLEQVKAGAKQGAVLSKQAAIANLQEDLAGEIQTQQATIAKLTAELNNAQTEFQRHQQLYEQGAISASELDNKSLVLDTASEGLNEAKANLNRTQRTFKARLQEAQANLAEISEVRTVDVQIAQAQLRQTKAAVAKAESDLELAYVRAPIDGEILAIHARSGEAVGGKGIAQLGQTDRMMVVAEIDRHDIDRVKIGQQATISSGIFDEQLQGRVHQVGFLIGKNDILDTDPAAKEDTRVVEVEILLDSQDSKRVAKLTNLEVDVAIKL
ncbi:MAG: response regulator [Cyanobacteria bacterium J06643_13]